ncbi:MAG: hypothetical protein WC871_03605 [Bacteroidales bacterium]
MKWFKKILEPVPLETVRVITSCTELTLDKFIRCLYRDELNVLAISGKPTREDLHAAWMELFTEYLSLVDVPSRRYTERLMADSVSLYTRVTVARWCIRVLYEGYDAQCSAKLAECGIPVIIPPDETDINYYTALDRAEAKVKPLVVEYNLKYKAYRDHVTGLENKHTTERDFNRSLASLSKFMGFQISTLTTTVYEYAGIISRMNQEAEGQKLRGDGKN